MAKDDRRRKLYADLNGAAPLPAPPVRVSLGMTKSGGVYCGPCAVKLGFDRAYDDWEVDLRGCACDECEQPGDDHGA